MNQDIRLHVDFWDHPKTMKLIRELGQRGPEHIQRLWVFAAKYHPTGILEGLESEDIAQICKYDGDAEELVDTLLHLGWIDYNDNCPHWSLHNWEKRNPWAARAEERSAIASKAAQTMHMKRKAYLQHANSMHEACEEHAQQSCAEHAQSMPHSAPSPSPLPKDKKKTSKEKVVKIVIFPEWLDLVLWKEFKNHRKLLKAPMNDHTEKMALDKLSRLRDENNDPALVIRQSMEEGWKGLFELPINKRTFKKSPDKPKEEPWLPDVSGCYPDEKL